MLNIEGWLYAYALTHVIEMGAYVQALAPRPLRERLALAFAASAITHPIVWYVIPEAMRDESRWTVIAAAEIFATLTEALWLWTLGVRWPLLWSLLANGSSFTAGLFLYRRGLWV